MLDDPAQVFLTHDLGIASYLVAKDWPLLRVEHAGARAVFAFPPGAAQAAGTFRLPGSNSVDARRFHLALRELRALARGVQP